MVLQLDSWAVAGAQSSAQIARLQLQSASSSGNGVVNVDDLRVRPLAVPGASVRIDSGAAIILGREQQFQGSYYAHNIGEATVDIEQTDSGGGRTDMIVLRVEDPSIDGTEWVWDPATEPVYYFRVIQGVSSAAVDLPPGYTGVPLARIALPANTATITSEMITDLRQSANPKSQRVLRVQRGGTQTNGEWDEAGNVVEPDWERWPQHDWTVTIPTWATQVQILGNWDNVAYDPRGGNTGEHDARGKLRVGLAGSQFIHTTESAYNFNPTTATNKYRCSAANRDQILIPAAMRGETVQVRMYCSGTAGQRGRLIADNYANFSADMEFLEIPAPEAEL